MRKFVQATVTFCMVLSVFSTNAMKAYEFSDSDIDYYNTFCSKPLNTQEDANLCGAYKAWMRERAENLQNQAGELQNQINTVQGSVEEMGYQIEQLRLQVETLENQIYSLEQSIAIAEEEIYKLSLQIEEKEADIAIRDEQIKQRMVDTQSFVGVNAYIDVIMGASDLVDLVRRVSVLQDITSYEQDQIAELNQMIEALEFDKAESERIRQQAEDDKIVVEQTRNAVAEQQAIIQAKQMEMIAEIEAMEAAMREAESASSGILNMLPMLNDTVFDAIQGNNGFTHPMQSSYVVSAHTWAYPDGGLHLGMDFAVPVGTNIHAPANGLILYADNPVSSTNGYLGNWVGWPRGGGNTISMVGVVNGTTYMFSFFHLAQSPWYVSAGQEVGAGQVIAASGHSGNSTGPHLHFEVINMGSMTIQQVYNQFKLSADFAGGTGWSSTNTACSVKGSAPCRERPEDLGF